MARFVVLQHDDPRGCHWDLMVEQGASLATWALPEAPGTGPILARQLPDHRLVYLDYEGPVAGGRGSVTRWDSGSCTVEQRSDDTVILVFCGQRLKGRAVLRQCPEAISQWELLFTPSRVADNQHQALD